MLEVVKILIGLGILISGVFIGKILAKYTEEELAGGQIYFKILTLIGLIIGLVGLFLENDVLLFTGFFVAIVTSQSIEKKKKKLKKNSKKKKKSKKK